MFTLYVRAPRRERSHSGRSQVGIRQRSRSWSNSYCLLYKEQALMREQKRVCQMEMDLQEERGHEQR